MLVWVNCFAPQAPADVVNKQAEPIVIGQFMRHRAIEMQVAGPRAHIRAIIPTIDAAPTVAGNVHVLASGE